MTEEPKYGPAMSRLNERQRAFVTSMLDYGGKDNTKAAIEAGYEGTPVSIRVQAHRLAHDEKIQLAIREEAQKRLNASTVMAVNILLEIADDVTVAEKSRLTAIGMILDRTGLHATTEQKVTVTRVDETSAEMVKRIEQLATGLGLDAQKLLGNCVTVDAEFVEVKKPEDDLSDLFA